MSLTFDTLDAENRRAMNRADEQRIREALGTGTVRDEWPPAQGFWRWIVGSIAAGIAMGVFLAWVLT